MRALVIAIVCALGACGNSRGGVRLPEATQSNILRDDYIGSSTCGDCHTKVYEAWEKSPMRNMTRDAATATIRAPFDGATLTVGTDTATMEMEGSARFVRITSRGKTSRFRVTKVVGGRYREDFVGVDVTGVANPLTCAVGVDMTGTAPACGVERVLPATYVFSTQSWRYKGYSVMVKERPSMSVRAVWANDCIPCHNTLPLATMLYDELYGPGLPAYQGKLSDRLLPASLLWRVYSDSESKLVAALKKEIAFLGGDQAPNDSLRAVLRAAAIASNVHLDDKKLVEVGIGCEACHNGAREHVENGTVVRYDVASDLVRVYPPDTAQPTRAQWINRTCAKCHTVLFSRYPWTWEGGQRKSDPGGSTTNSGEGRDYQLGGCAKEMACTTCHDPHAQDPSAQLATLATTAGNKLCVGCHATYTTAAAQQAHSHHGATSAGNACIGCHMPKKNMGLDYALVRYHRIGSPNDKKRTGGDRPLECALCHADKSVESIAQTMEQWYRKPIDRAALRKLYGDNLDTNVMRATLFRGKPHEQAVAMMSLTSASGAKIQNPIAIIAPHMAHDYPLVRFYAKRALEEITGTKIDIDVNKPAAELRPLIDAWLAAQR